MFDLTCNVELRQCKKEHIKEAPGFHVPCLSRDYSLTSKVVKSLIRLLFQHNRRMRIQEAGSQTSEDGPTFAGWYFLESPPRSKNSGGSRRRRFPKQRLRSKRHKIGLGLVGSKNLLFFVKFPGTH